MKGMHRSKKPEQIVIISLRIADLSLLSPSKINRYFMHSFTSKKAALQDGKTAQHGSVIRPPVMPPSGLTLHQKQTMSKPRRARVLLGQHQRPLTLCSRQMQVGPEIKPTAESSHCSTTARYKKTHSELGSKNEAKEAQTLDLRVMSPTSCQTIQRWLVATWECSFNPLS